MWIEESHLLLLEVADSLNRSLALNGGGGISGFQLDDRPGPLVQSVEQSLKFIHLFLFFLFRAEKHKIRGSVSLSRTINHYVKYP